MSDIYFIIRYLLSERFVNGLDKSILTSKNKAFN